MFLSASKVTVSPALTSWSFLPLFSPFVVAAEVAFQAAALIASATLPTVAILFSLPAVTVGTAAVLMLPVLTFTPSLVTVIVLSAALTSNFTFAPLAVVTVSPFFTSSCFVTVTVVPLPLTKFTWSSAPIPDTLVLGSPAIFQPKATFLAIECN